MQLWMFDEAAGRWVNSFAHAFTNGTTIASSEGIAEGPDGRICALGRLGPHCFDGDQWQTPEVPPVSPDYAINFPGVPDDNFTLELMDPFRTMFKTRSGNIWIVRADQMLEYNVYNWLAKVKPPTKIEKEYCALDVRKVDGYPHMTLQEIADKSAMMMVPPKSKVGQEFSALIAHKPTTILSETYCGLEDADGDIWLGADRAIVSVDPAKREWKLYALPRNLIQAALIYEGRDRRLWFADIYGNAASYDKRAQSWTGYKVTEQNPRKADFVGSPAYSINAIYQDRAGRLMFGCFDGLIVFTEAQNKWDHFTAENSALPGITLIGSETVTTSVTALMEDHTGRIWVATRGGIVILEP
jgi:hypothetical protein